MHKRWWLTLGAVVVVMGVAVFFRFYDIKHYPPGLFPDEAANGEDVLLILDGDWRPFYPRGNGREALFFYLQALMVKIFGIGVWPMHAAAAMVGTLTVLATYFATRVWFGRLAGVMAALFLATNHWHVTLSRTGFRAILIPLFIALFTAFAGYVVQSYRRGQYQRAYGYAALAGVAFAGGFYTYIAYRAMIGVMIGMGVLMLISGHIQRYWRHILLGFAAALVTLLPLGLYFFNHQNAFVGRAGQVSVFNPDLQLPGGVMPTIFDVTRRTILSFFLEGDLNWRHNVSGYPLLNPLVAFLFLLGLAWLIKGLGEVVYRVVAGKEVHYALLYVYIVLLLGGMLLPVITTAEGIPHGLRSLGLVFPIFCLAGVAAAVFLHWVGQWSHEHGRALVVGSIAGLLCLGVVYDGTLYFLFARRSAQAAFEYRADLTHVAVFINSYRAQYPDRPRPYLVLDAFSVQTVHYLTSVAAHDFATHPDEVQHSYRLLDPAKSEATSLQPGEIIIFTQSTIPDADRYEQTYRRQVQRTRSLRNIFNQELMRVYEYSGEPPPVTPDDQSLDA